MEADKIPVKLFLFAFFLIDSEALAMCMLKLLSAGPQSCVLPLPLVLQLDE